MMKMAPASTITLFLLCCSVITSTGSQCEQYVATGGSFDVPLNLKVEELSALRWLKDLSVIFWKKQTVLKGKLEDITATGSLKLRNLTKSDAGKYTPEAFKSGASERGLNSTHICVLDPVRKPKVKETCTETKVHFDCLTGQNDGKVTVKWLKNNEAVQQGYTVIKEAKEVDKVAFACTVSNEVSSLTSEPVTQTCYKSAFPEELYGISIWVFVGGGGGIVLVLILVVIICCVRTKRRQQLQIKDEEELRLGWTNPEQQQHHHHHHHQHQHHHPDHQHPPNHHHHQQQQRPAGHTGPRQSRSKQHRDQQRPRAPEPPKGHPQANARRPPQPRPADTTEDEQPPPLPQPRKKATRPQRV